MDGANDKALVSNKMLTCQKNGGNFPLFLQSITREGCVVGFGETRLSTGEPVAISLAGGTIVRGWVLWCSDDSASIRFFTPVSGSDVEANSRKPASLGSLPSPARAHNCALLRFLHSVSGRQHDNRPEAA